MPNFQGDVTVQTPFGPINIGVADDMINARTDGNDNVNSGKLDDTVYISKGSDNYNGGTHTNGDTLSARFFDNSVNVDLAAGTVNTGYGEQSTAINFENYRGAADGNYQDNVRGSEADNVISTYGGDDFVTVSRGNDIYNAGDGVDTLNAGWLPAEGVDVATAAIFNMATGDYIWSENGAGYVTKANDFENYLGLPTDAADTVTGTDADNVIFTYNGNDVVYLSRGDDTLDAGAGDADWLKVGGLGGDTWVNANLETGVVTTGEGDESSANNFENYKGRSFNGKADYVTGSSADNVIKTESGQDTVALSKGSDTLDGGSNFDYINARTSQAEGIDQLQSATVLMDQELLLWHDGTQVHEQTIKNFEGYLGTDQTDWVVGNDERNHMYTFGGNDTIYGKEGNDIMDAGLGTNYVHGGEDIDTVNLGDHEFVSTSKTWQGVHLKFQSNVDGQITTVNQSTENINLNGQGTTWDAIWQSHRVDVIDPNLKDKNEKDLTGSYLNEDFFSGKGKDNLTGHGGSDFFHYNKGKGKFVKKHADHILDFDTAEGDKFVLDVSGFKKKWNAADASVLIVGQGGDLDAAMQTEHEFVYFNNGTSGSLYFNKNGEKGDKKPEKLMFAELTGNSTLELGQDNFEFV